MFMVLTSWLRESLWEFTQFTRRMQNSARWMPTFGPSWQTWLEPLARLQPATKLNPSLPFVITQPGSWYSFYHPTEGWVDLDGWKTTKSSFLVSSPQRCFSLSIHPNAYSPCIIMHSVSRIFMDRFNPWAILDMSVGNFGCSHGPLVRGHFGQVEN